MSSSKLSRQPVHSNKPHLCVKPDVTHPCDRWETLYVYSFICKFTNLREKVEGFESVTDLEIALLEKEPSSILQQILARFVLNLRPATRNLSVDQISSTVASLLADYFKTAEKTVYWNEELGKNVDPFEGREGGFFGGDWDFRLILLRQLVDLQLTHCAEIKSKIDRAWGVVHNKHKQKGALPPPLDPSDPDSKERLQVLPIGQDKERKRFWIADDSPRVYSSTNPWRCSSNILKECTTRDEYLKLIENIKATAPAKKKSRQEEQHHRLIKDFEDRIEVIDRELARVAKVRRKIEQRQILMAQAEIRQTRTRRQTRRPDYVYNDDLSEDGADGADDYVYQDDEDDEFRDDAFIDDSEAPNGRSRRRTSAAQPQRRSARAAAMNSNGKRSSPSDSHNEWKGERRSARLGATAEMQLDDEPHPKRARTEESTVSVTSESPSATASTSNDDSHMKAMKSTETAVEQVAGKKKSKYWFYAVEPVSGAGAGPAPMNGTAAHAEPNGSHHTHANGEQVMPMEVDGKMEERIAPSDERPVASPSEA